MTRRPMRLAWRLTLTILLAMVPVVGLGLGVLSARSEAALEEATWSEVEQAADLVAGFSAGELAFGTREESARTLARLQESPTFHAATLYDADGQRFASWARAGDDPAGVAEALVPALPPRARTKEAGHLELVVPVSHDGERFGTLVVSAGDERLADQVHAYRLTLAWLVAVLGLLAFGVAVAIQGGITRPIRALSRAARRIAAGDSSLRVVPTGDREIRVLGESLNVMLDALLERQRSLELARRAEHRTSAWLRLVGQLQADSLAGVPLTDLAVRALAGLADRLGVPGGVLLLPQEDGAAEVLGAHPATRTPGGPWADWGALVAGVEPGGAVPVGALPAPGLAPAGAVEAEPVALGTHEAPLGLLLVFRLPGAPAGPEDRVLARELADLLTATLRRRRLAAALERHNAELEQRIAERTAQLAAREAAWRLVLHNADGLLVVDESGVVRFANPAAVDLLGQGEALVGQAPDLLLVADQVTTFELRAPVGTETRSFAARAVAIDWEGSPCVLASIRDITDQRSLEAQLRHSQKVALVGRLAGGIAHDFNNVLMTIGGTLELVSMEEDLSPRIQRHLGSALDCVGRGAGLTRKLLDFSRRRKADVELVELGHFTRAMRDLLERLVGEGIEVDIHVDEGDWWVEADPVELEQVVINLVANARDAQGPSGSISLRVGAAELPEAVELTVLDAGPGIPADVLPHVFEPFFTTKDVGEGTGLGLSTVFGIIDSLRGHVVAESPEEGGARFTVRLPRAVPAAAPASAPASPPEDLAARTEHVLLVDDDADIREVVREFLRLQGFRVDVADGGAQALALAERWAPGDLQILISDIRMPRMDGLELSARLRRRHPDIGCLFITGFGDDVLETHGVAQGELHILDKPFGLADLSRALARVREDRKAATAAEVAG